MIRFAGFTKTYAGHTAVDRLTLGIERGEVVALLGPNGSGKTTTLKAAAGLLAPTSGTVLLGEPGRPASDASARAAVSFLPQRVAFPDSLTGREVVEFYRRLRGLDAARTAEVLRFASLNGSSARAVSTYSGGMTQRLGLAVAILPEAPVLLLDEPTAALDPDGLSAFYGLIERRRRADQTVLFTSHQLGDVERLADRFVILVNGRLTTVLTGRELAARLGDRGVMKVRLAACPDGIARAGPADRAGGVVGRRSARRARTRDRSAGRPRPGETGRRRDPRADDRRRPARHVLSRAGAGGVVMRAVLLLSTLALAGCGSGPLPPATLDARGDTCGYCRMAVSPAGVAAQVVAPGEEPRFFDDIGCLASFLEEHARAAPRRDRLRGRSRHAQLGVGGWRHSIRECRISRRRCARIWSPMSTNGRAETIAVAARGTAVTVADVFGARVPPGPKGPGLHPGVQP